MEDLYYLMNDDTIIAHKDMLFTDPDSIIMSGSWDDCAMQKEAALEQDLLDQQYAAEELWEEMQELDPRDYERLDDFGDPTT